MITATMANEESRVSTGEVTGRSRRFSYSKLKNGRLKFVVVDIDWDDKEEWSEQEPGEVCWYAFKPSTAERRIVDRWIKSGRILNEWTRIIDDMEWC
jgi:hypothetical protein